MPERYVLVYQRGGRWTWRLVENEERIENGPAYPTRTEAVRAASNLFPKLPIEVEGK